MVSDHLKAQIQQARLNVRAARLARGINGEILTPAQLAVGVDAANDKLNELLNLVPR